MKSFADLDAMNAAYKAYYGFASELELAEEQAWAEFASLALVENECG